MKNNKVFFFISGIIILLIILGMIFDKVNKNNKDSEYYLNSPWVTERVGWFLVQLPEKWNEEMEEVKKNKSDYAEIANDVRIFEMKFKDIQLVCFYMELKDGIYESFDLDVGTSAVTNQILYNLKCEDMSLNKIEPYDNPLEVVYMATSKCPSYHVISQSKGVRFENHTLVIITIYKSDDLKLGLIANKILDGIQNKYPITSQ